MDIKNKIILYFPGLYPSQIGGMEIYNYYLYKALTLNIPDANIILLTNCKFLFNKKNILPLKNKLFLKTKFGLGTLSTVLYYMFSRKFNWRDIKMIFIPYTSNFEYNAIAFILLKKIFNVQYVVHIHGGGLKKWKTYKLQQLFFKYAYKVAAVSTSIKEEYEKRIDKNIQIIPPLIPYYESRKLKNILQKEYFLDDYKKIILFVGSIKPLKAPEVLIKAFLQLGSDYINDNKLGLIMVGGGEMLEVLKEKYAKYLCIKFMGKVENEKVRDFYKMASIYVISSWFEGTPLSLLEAMFNKVACIGTNVSGINKIIKDEENGLLFEKNNEKELTQKLSLLIDNEEKCKSLGLNAKIYFEDNYNYPNYFEKILNFIL